MKRYGSIVQEQGMKCAIVTVKQSAMRTTHATSKAVEGLQSISQSFSLC